MYEVNQQELIEAVSEELQGTLEMPDWAQFVKTGIHKERPPVQDDWWYMRAASILRQVQLKGPIGVSKLRYKYGGRKNNGMGPEHFYKGSGKIIRTILQQLEKAKLVEQGQKGVHKGRILTSAGETLLFNTAKKMDKKPKPAKKAVKAKKDTKKDTNEDKQEDNKSSKQDNKKDTKEGESDGKE